MKGIELKGWNYIVYELIKKQFNNRVFSLSDIYKYVPEFKKVYPENNHIEDKIRQILQKLRDKGLVRFIGNKGKYELINKESQKMETKIEKKKETDEVVYLLSNDSIPGWVKIGRTSSIDSRLKDLYNTSVPLPFKLEDVIKTNTYEDSKKLEKSIHMILDTINPDLRKNTEAKKREFFRLNIEKAKEVFNLVRVINNVSLVSEMGLLQKSSIN